MPDPDVVEGEVMDEQPGTALAVPSTLFHTDDPVEVVARASRTATALKEVIDSRGLTATIQGRKHVKIEGWTLLGSMVGVFAVTTGTEQVKDAQGNDAYQSTVEARRPNPAAPTGYDVVGAATAMCSRGENLWSYEPTGRGGKRIDPRDDHALLSMSQTRAASKALASALRFVVELAGYASTPAEEMPRDETASEPKPTIARLNELLRLLTKLEERNDWPQIAKDFCANHFGKDTAKDLTPSELGSLIAEMERQVVRLEAEDGPV